MRGSVKKLRKLKLVLVSAKNRKLDLQWKQLVATHHYLGYRPLCGAQLRYLIVCEHGYVGALGFSAAALYLKARERWIGWSHAARQAHLRKVVANSRFVIAHGVKVTNLASKVLGMAQKRLAQDWAQAYGYSPLLLETYVESKRFGATSYRAANWIYVGKTCGRGRQDREHERKNRSRTSICIPCSLTAKKALRGAGPGASLADTVRQAAKAAVRLGGARVWQGPPARSTPSQAAFYRGARFLRPARSQYSAGLSEPRQNQSGLSIV